MKFKNYIKDNIFSILFQINVFGMIAVLAYLLGNPAELILLLGIAWAGLFLIFFGIQFYIKKHKIEKLLFLLENLPDKYLISEIMDKPSSQEEQLYYYILKSACKSMMEKVRKSITSKKQYKEYIEQWVHEIKTPIAGIKLIALNNKSEVMREILLEIESMERYVEQVLYYAKSETVEQDYVIRKCKIMDICHEAISLNYLMLLNNKIQVEMSGSDVEVFTDEKWCIFILSQLITNSIKYKSKVGRCILKFYLNETGHDIQLHIWDNGIGISDEDLSKIFEKGFTGRNNEGTVRSTGMGLYICQKLCGHLGIGLQIISEEGVFTEALLTFPNEHSIE